MKCYHGNEPPCEACNEVERYWRENTRVQVEEHGQHVDQERREQEVDWAVSELRRYQIIKEQDRAFLKSLRIEPM